MQPRYSKGRFQIWSNLLQVHYDSSTEPNFEAMGEDNVIANMTCVCIVGIEVTKSELFQDQRFWAVTKSDFELRLFLLGSSAARGASLYQAMPARGHHGPHGHRGQHQHGQGHRDQVGYKSFPNMDLDIWRCISLLGVELFLRVMVTWWWKARSSTNGFETLTLARSELFFLADHI